MLVETFEPSAKEVAFGVVHATAWLAQGLDDRSCVTVVFFLSNGDVLYASWASRRGAGVPVATMLKRARELALSKVTSSKWGETAHPASLREALNA